MKLTGAQLRRAIRRVLLEAKFESDKPLDRDAIQIALGIHPDQDPQTQLENSEAYAAARSEMVSFVEILWDNGDEEDITRDSIVDIFEDYYADIIIPYNPDVEELSTSEYRMVFEDLLDDGTLEINEDGLVISTNSY